MIRQKESGAESTIQLVKCITHRFFGVQKTVLAEEASADALIDLVKPVRREVNTG